MVDKEKLSILSSNIKKIQNHKLNFCFTDGHAIEEISNFYTNIDDLCKLDFHSIHTKEWSTYYPGVDEDCKRRKQSEFLVKDKVPIDVFIGIGFFDEEIKKISC